MDFKKMVDKNRVEIALFTLTIVVFTLYGAFQFPILRDHGMYSLVAQEALNGNPIYSIPEIKGPFLYMADAICMVAFGFLPNWMAIRVGMLIIAGLTTALFYRLVSRMLDRTTALFASIVLMSFAFFAEYFILGDPKGIVLFLLMLGFNALFSGRNFLAGACFMLCPFTWQPSALFMIGPLAYYFLEGFDRKKLASFALGAALPTLLIFGYFAVTSTISNLLEFAIILPHQYKSMVYFKDTMLAIFNIIACYNTEILFLTAGVLGSLYYSWKHGRILAKRKMLYLKEHKMAASFIACYIPFSMYILADMQIADDFIIHLSLISIVCGIMLQRAHAKLSGKLHISGKKTLAIMMLLLAAYSFLPAMQPLTPENYVVTYTKNLQGTIPALEMPSAVIEKFGLADSVSMLLLHRTGEEHTVQDQIKVADYINSRMTSDDKILSLAAPEILFLAERSNINRYPLIESDFFQLHINQTSSVSEFRDDIIRGNPKFVIYNFEYIIDYLGIRDFIETEYKKIDDVKYIIYERK